MKNMRIIRKEKGLTLKRLGELVGVSESTVSQYENQKRQPDQSTLLKLANVLNCTTDYLLGKSDTQTNTKAYIRIPVLGSVPAGTPIEAIEDIIDYEDVSLDSISKEKEYFALKLKGDSMSPKYLDGDIVIIQRQPTCENGQDAIVMVDGEDATFKKVILKKDSIVLQPYNPNHVPLFFSAKEIEELPVVILGIVIELRRSMI